MLPKPFKIIILIGLICVGFSTAHAQIYFKSEYIPYSSFKDESGKKLGGKGDLKTVDGTIRIPLSIKMNENNRPTAWAIALGVSLFLSGLEIERRI